MTGVRRQKKICVLGDFSVGKTSLVRRYVLDEFSADYHATVGVKIYQHQGSIRIGDDDVEVSQSIWDIEGSKFGKQLVANYIAGASGALIVGDLTRDDVLASMTSHAETFLQHLPGRPVIFALNKADLAPPAMRPDGDVLTRQFGGASIQTSALTGEEVSATFSAMLRRIVEIGA